MSPIIWNISLCIQDQFIPRRGMGKRALSFSERPVFLALLLVLNLVNQNFWFNVVFDSSTENYDFCFAALLATIWKQVSYETVETSGLMQFCYFNTYLFRQIFYYSCANFSAFFFFLQKTFYFSPVLKLTNTHRESSFCMLLTLTNFTYQGLVILVPPTTWFKFQFLWFINFE